MQESQAEIPTYMMKTKLQTLREQLEETKYKAEEELFTKHTYLHMLDRMKKDFIASKISSHTNDISLKNKSQILDLEQQK